MELYENLYNWYKSKNIQNELPHWEHYNGEFWRLSVSDIDGYCESPLCILLFCILNYVKYVFGYHVGYMVLQLVEKGSKMSLHSDKFGERKLSFIYYLTPDDCNGGELRVHKGEKWVDIKPKFNRLVAWRMEDSPMHEVLENLSDNRFSIVGFGF